MRIKQFFKLATIALAMGLTACNNEIDAIDDNQGLSLKDGETAVHMNIAGLNGKTVSRAAGDNITLPGEVKLDKIDIYCFVDLDDQSTSAAVTGIDNYTLERVYHYEAQGTTNDIVLNPDGDGYKASFGIMPAADRKRAFILVANDSETRTVTPKADITAGNDRSGATAFSAVKAWDILAVDLSTTAANLTTPLIMESTAQWSAYDTDGTLRTSSEYDAAKLAEGISATLARRVARIDISNPIATGFTVTDVTLTGAKNATLFGTPAAAGANQTVVFAAKTVHNAEVINAALYTLPMNANDAAGEFPSISIKGKLGSTEITLAAEFKGNTMIATTKGMQPNTRYVVNIINNEGNLTANISVADWVYGETVDTDDIMSQLNAAATLAAEGGVALLGGDNDKTLYITYNGSGYNDGDAFATITGATSDDKTIGIVLPADCDWIDVDRTVSTPSQAAEFKLKFNSNTTTRAALTRPRTATLSLITWNDTDKKQVINEYTIHQDYMDITQCNTALDDPITTNCAGVRFNADMTVAYLPSFASSHALLYVDNPGTSAVDVLIPEGCDWLQRAADRDPFFRNQARAIVSTDNTGTPERQTVITVRRWNAATETIETKEITVIQTGTLDKSLLSPTFEIVANSAYAAANAIRIDEAQRTIVICGDNADVADDKTYAFYIRGAGADLGQVKPVYASFGASDNRWITPVTDFYTNLSTNLVQYDIKVPFVAYNDLIGGNGPREMNITITTYANGVPAEKTYRLIQKAKGVKTVD